MNTTSGLMLIFFLAVCLGGGGVGSIAVSKGMRDWYPTLHKPAVPPSAWLFGPVWTALYVLMAISAWLIWREYGWGARAALLIFFAQLALNLGWSGMFFGARLPGAALAEIVILWLAVTFNLIVFWFLKAASAFLLFPYLLWVTYAGYMN